jgi:hypothetical protein
MRGPRSQSGGFRHRAVLGALAALTITVTACTSDARPPTTTSDAATLSVPTPAASTAAPTTTQVPNDATPLVHQAVLDYWSAHRQCSQRPKQCKPESFTAQQGTLRHDVQAYVSTLLSEQYRLATVDTAAPGGTAVSVDDAYVVVNAVTVDLTTNATATTDECVYDPTPMLGPAGPDGQPTVVSADAAPHRFVHTFVLEDGRWLAAVEDVDTSGACDITPDTVPVDFTTPTS